MGWSESERGLCKKHPGIKQFPGAVCSLCLSEKLSQLYAPSAFPQSKLTPDFLGYGFLPIHSRSSSNDSSASSSPPIDPPRQGQHKRTASESVGRSMSFMFSGELAKHGGGRHQGVMKKSRSVTVVTKSIGSFGDTKNGKKKKKKIGFWSKLIKGTGRKTKMVFKHSKSVVR